MGNLDALETFRAYDFDGNEQWKAYLKNVEIPDASNAALDKVKAKWYRRVVDPDFDVALVTASTMPKPAPAQPSPAPTSSSGPAAGANTSTSSSPRPGWSRASSGPTSTSGAGAAPRHGGSQLQNYGAAAHGLSLLAAVLHLQPLLRGLSAIGYMWALRFGAAAQAISMYQRYGAPRNFRSLDSWKAWAPAALGSAEFFAMTLQLMYMSLPPLYITLVPGVVAALYGVTDYLAQHYHSNALYARFGAPLRSYLLPRQAAAAMYVALSEILVAFAVVLLLLTPQRNLLAIYFLWTQLKFKYWLPATAAPHRQAWSLVDQHTLVLRQRLTRMLPILQKGLDLATGWFLTHPGGNGR